MKCDENLKVNEYKYLQSYGRLTDIKVKKNGLNSRLKHSIYIWLVGLFMWSFQLKLHILTINLANCCLMLKSRNINLKQSTNCFLAQENEPSNFQVVRSIWYVNQLTLRNNCTNILIFNHEKLLLWSMRTNIKIILSSNNNIVILIIIIILIIILQ